MLELISVNKHWTDFSLLDISFRVEEGEYFVLLGPSGAGKSLLLEVIAGFHVVDGGQVLLDGRAVTHLPPEKRQVGFVCQDSMLFPHLTARDNVAYGPRLRRRPAPAIRQTVERLAGMLRIEHVLDRSPHELSGGERQRVAIARALAVEPRLLLMDEPLGALDPVTQNKLRSELRGVHQQTGVTILHVTHDQGEACELGRRIGVMQRGRLLQVGEPAEVFERPSDPFVAEFTGCPNIYEGQARLEGLVSVFRCGSLTLFSTARVQGPARAAVRPEHVFISTEPVKTSARNQIAGRVASVERQGRVHAVTAQFDGLEMTSLITAQSLQELGIRPGSRVYFSIKASSLHLMKAEGPAADQVERPADD